MSLRVVPTFLHIFIHLCIVASIAIFYIIFFKYCLTNSHLFGVAYPRRGGWFMYLGTYLLKYHLMSSWSCSSSLQYENGLAW